MPHRFLFHPKITLAALTGLFITVGVQLGTLAAAKPIVFEALGPEIGTRFIVFAKQGAAWCALLVLVLGVICAAGRSIVPMIDAGKSSPNGQ